MNPKDLKTIREFLSTPRKIAIVPHKNPDGDAMGACLGLWHYLRDLGHTALVISPNDYPKFLKWMPGTYEVMNYEKDREKANGWLTSSGLIFTLDFNHLNRSGQMEDALEKASADFIMIDHHQEPSDYASARYSDIHMSSTCEMVFNLIKSMGDISKITPDIANCLYAGILTDTGSFKYSATTSKTHRVAATLIEHGARNTEIHNQIFDTNTPERLQLLGCALRNLVILRDYNTAYTSLSQDELDAHNYKKGDTEGFVNYGLTLEGVHFAAIFIENREENIIKISFRSEGEFSVNEFARTHYEGGGHKNAAGGRSVESMEATLNHFQSLLPTYSEELSK